MLLKSIIHKYKDIKVDEIATYPHGLQVIKKMVFCD